MKTTAQSEAELAVTAAKFLQRVQLQGAEAPAFMAVSQWLMSKSQAPLPPMDIEPMPHGDEKTPEEEPS